MEDIDLYGRLHEQFHMIKPSEKRANDAIEGFDNVAWPTRVEKVVCFTSMSGLLSQDKYLPFRYCPLQVELEVVGRANEALGRTSPAFTLDNSLDNECAQHLLSGKSLLISAHLQLLHKLLSILTQPSMYHVL